MRLRILGSVIITVLIVVIFGGVVGLATDGLTLIDLPPVQLYEITTITPEGVEEYRNQVTFSVFIELNEVEVVTTGSDYVTKSIYDLNFQLLTSDMQVIDPEDAYRVGFDQRLANYISEDDRIEIKFYLDNEKQDEREIYLKDYGIEMEVLGLALQTQLLREETDFHGQIIDINGVGRYNLDSDLLTPKEITKLAEGRHMAPQVQTILANNEDIYVYSFGYNGMLRWFFPMRFHVVLEKEIPHRILAFWGGSGDLLRYQVYQYQ